LNFISEIAEKAVAVGGDIDEAAAIAGSSTNDIPDPAASVFF